MKTPVSYYGGKQKMVTTILPLIPSHNCYVEPFCGGAAIFFSKPQSNVEVLNDTNKELMNFYRVIQSDFSSLEKEVRITLHSRSAHRDAVVINAASSYPSPVLAKHTAENGWNAATHEFTLAVTGLSGKPKRKKIEVLTSNFEMPIK